MMDTKIREFNICKDKSYKSLHDAVKKGNQEIAKTFLLNGADVNAEDEFKKSPLMYAIENTDLIITRLLLANGANMKDPKLLNTAVAIALEGESIEIVELLLQHGADVNVSDEDGRTALHFTPLNKCDLVGKESDYDIEVRGDPVKGVIANLLLCKGANVDAETKSGETPLQIATQRSYTHVVEALLEYNANVNARNKSNMTPLHKAVGQRLSRDLLKDMVITLIKYGADVNATQEDGRTALHIACELGDHYIVNPLLEFGSDINITDRQDHTPLEKFFSSFDYLLNGSNTDGFYYDCERAIYNDEDIPELFKRHMISMTKENLFLNEKNWIWFIRANCRDQNNDPFERENEIEDLKSEKLNNSNVSFYDILTKTARELVVYARNENIVQLLESYDFKTKYPILGDLVRRNFRRAVARKEMLEQGSAFFYFLFKNVPELPYDCTQKILNYLSDTDLKICIESLNISKDYNWATHTKRPKFN